MSRRGLAAIAATGLAVATGIWIWAAMDRPMPARGPSVPNRDAPRIGTDDAPSPRPAGSDRERADPAPPPPPAAVATQGLTVRGVVVDPAGAPIHGAIVAPGRRHYLESRFDEERAVHTAADGSFALPAMKAGDRFVAMADGFVDHEHGAPEGSAHVVITMARTLSIRGRVFGVDGQPVEIRLSAAPDGRAPPGYAQRKLGERIAVDAAEPFAVDGLGPGDYVVRAWAAGLGSSRPVPFHLPAEPGFELELAIVADVDLLVRVVDDRGGAVEGALVAIRDAVGNADAEPPDRYEIARLLRDYDQETTSDARGRATLRVAPFAALDLAASAEGHVANARRLVAAPAHGETVSVALQRGGTIAATLEDADELARFEVEAYAWPADARGDERIRSRRKLRATDGPTFVSDILPPGPYLVGVRRGDRTARYLDRDAAEVPLLGSFLDSRHAVPLEVRPGVRTDVTLPAAKFGEIRGVVLRGGVPVAGVLVLGTPEPRPAWIDSDSAEQLFPHTSTDVDGAFRFACSRRGTWHLHARHPDAPFAQTLAVRIEAPGTARDVVITLDDGRIRGRCDVSWIPQEDREFTRAQLFRIEDAGLDPFVATAWSLDQDTLEDGAFAFELLAPGRWLLRIIGRGSKILRQDVLDIGAGQRLDLGTLDLQFPRVPLRLAVRWSEVGGAWLRRVEAGVEGGLFQEVARVEDGTVDFGAVPAGRYVVEGFRRKRVGGVHRLIGDSITDPVEIEVRNDGTVTPAEIF